MRLRLRRAMYDRRGVAAIEFALITPVLLLMLGSLADFALAFRTRGLLASSVAQGAQYAFLVGPTVAAADVQSVVEQPMALPPADVTVTGPACACLSGTPAAPTPTPCSQTCPDQTLPGTYLTISAHYTYAPLLPVYSGLANPVLAESATVRLQ